MEPSESQEFPVLRLESSDNPPELVIIIQQKLGFSENQIDGVFNSVTDAAVRQYQELNALTVDGVVGADTWSDMGCEMLDGKLVCDANSLPGYPTTDAPPPRVPIQDPTTDAPHPKPPKRA